MSARKKPATKAASKRKASKAATKPAAKPAKTPASGRTTRKVQKAKASKPKKPAEHKHSVHVVTAGRSPEHKARDEVMVAASSNGLTLEPAPAWAITDAASTLLPAAGSEPQFLRIEGKAIPVDVEGKKLDITVLLAWALALVVAVGFAGWVVLKSLDTLGMLS